MSRCGWRLDNVPVPEPHLAALGAAAVAHLIWPARLPLARSTARVVGLVSIATGVGLAAWAVRSASLAGVAVDRPISLVTSGAFALGRNPMYQGWTLGLAGLGLASRSVWLLAASAVAARLAHQEVLAEETTLARSFGDAYAEYAAATPRYLGSGGVTEAIALLGRMVAGVRGFANRRHR